MIATMSAMNVGTRGPSPAREVPERGDVNNTILLLNNMTPDACRG
jgi:hypothetical protein